MNMKVPDKKLKQTEVCLTTMDLYKRNHKNLSKVKRAFIQVVKASNQTVILENGRDINLAERYHVEFRPNRYSFRVCQQSLERLKKLKLEKFFETFKEKYLTNQKQIPQNIPVNVQKLEWVDSKIGSNPEQMSAVRNILSCTAFPMPYVILGPRKCSFILI